MIRLGRWTCIPCCLDWCSMCRDHVHTVFETIARLLRDVAVVLIITNDVADEVARGCQC